MKVILVILFYTHVMFWEVQQFYKKQLENR